VLLPKAVREDLFKRRSTKNRVQAIFESLAFFKRCDDYDKGAVDFLLAEREREGSRDRGEVEAVVQASKFGATVIVDDAWGRELAARDDLQYHGTFWVLQRFYEFGLYSSADCRRNFVSLRNRGIRLPWTEVNAFLKSIKELPIEP